MLSNAFRVLQKIRTEWAAISFKRRQAFVVEIKLTGGIALTPDAPSLGNDTKLSHHAQAIH